MLRLIALVVMASTPVEAFNIGNQHYAQKDFAGAALAYQEALQAGPNAAVHFNLGNALFKSGRIGQAIVHYRRAHYLAPRDPEIASNLGFARAYRVDKLLSAQSPLARAIDEALHRLSRREASLLAAVFFMLTGACVAGWIVSHRPGLVVAAALCGLTSAYGLLSQQAWASEVSGRPAVVVVPEVHALSGPEEDSKEILLLHDGTEVRIRETRSDYLLVQLPGGGGWVRKDAVERIY